MNKNHNYILFIVANHFSYYLIDWWLLNNKEHKMKIIRNGTQNSTIGDATYFTGNVRVDPLFMPEQGARTSGATVTFEPNARTAWHTHPIGQTLIVIAGSGLIQRFGEPIQELNPGDIVWIGEGEKHWHGANSKTAMVHIAIQEKLDEKYVDW